MENKSVEMIMKCMFFLLLVFSVSAQNRWQVKPQSEYSKFLVGSKVKNLHFSNQSKLIENDYKLTLICAFDSDCPMSQKIGSRAQAFRRVLYTQKLGLFICLFLAFDGNEKVTSACKTRGFKGELVFDKEKKLQSYFGLRTTCEVILIDASGTIVFRCNK